MTENQPFDNEIKTYSQSDKKPEKTVDKNKNLGLEIVRKIRKEDRQ